MAGGYTDISDDNETNDSATMEQMIQSLCKGMKKANQNVKMVRDELQGIKTTILAELEDRLEAANDRIDALTKCNREL